MSCGGALCLPHSKQAYACGQRGETRPELKADRRAARWRDAEYQGDERGAERLPSETGGAEHAARAAAALAWCGRQQLPVVGRLKEAEAHAANGHAPGNVGAARVRAERREQHEPRG